MSLRSFARSPGCGRQQAFLKSNSIVAVGGAEAVIFAGGIAENTKLVRSVVGNGLHWCGLHIDQEANERLIDIEGRPSTAGSRVQAWVIPVEESLQIAHECCQAAAPLQTSER